MIKCDRCGFDIPDNNRYCTNFVNHINDEIKLVKRKNDKSLFI